MKTAIAILALLALLLASRLEVSSAAECCAKNTTTGDFTTCPDPKTGKCSDCTAANPQCCPLHRGRCIKGGGYGTGCLSSNRKEEQGA